MKLGATLTLPLLSLLSKNGIDVDYIKVDGDVDVATLQSALAYRPVLLHDISYHFWLNYTDPFDDATMTKARTMIEMARAVVFHRDWRKRRAAGTYDGLLAGRARYGQLQPREVALANIVRNGKRLQEWVAMPLLLENFNYHPTNVCQYICEPPTFNALIDEIGCEMLLDLAHAREISVFNMGWANPRDYLSEFPLNKVREIHINHPYNDDGKQMLDRHLRLQESDLDILRWTLEHAPNVQAITLESETPNEEALLEEMALLRKVTR